MRAPVVSALLALSIWAGCGGNNNNDVDAPPVIHQCNDGLDNDGDGKIDFPADLGCTSADDDSEDSLPLPQCMDGVDNDGDGKIDYPQDPGCTVPNQDDETDDCPTGPGCPQCSDGIDNDGNGKTDYPMDPGCTSAADNDEFVHDPQACGASTTIKQIPASGIDNGALAAASTGALPNACGGSATAAVPMVAYELHLDVPHVVFASTNGSPTDTVLDIRSAPCSATDASIACNNDISGTVKSSELTVPLGPGNYYVVVAGRTTAAIGNYTLRVQLFNGEGTACNDTSMCGPGLVCRVKLGATAKTCEKHVCEDGVDDDADGKNDYPDDPGCANGQDDDETDDCPNGPTCPQCANGIDDDGDGNTDYPMDISCHAASDPSESCSTTEGLQTITSASTSGTTTGATNDYTPSCASPNSAPDLLYRLDLPAMQQLSAFVSTSPTFWESTLVMLDSTCGAGGTEFVCGTFGDFTVNNVPAGTYYMVIDGLEFTTDSGSFNLQLNGTIAPGGSCEGPMFASGAFQCAGGLLCEGTAGARICSSQCSNGLDDNGDGKTDWPNDPGCSSPFDDSETTVCPGAMCPACADGIDNDADGFTDWPMDINCAGAGSTSESCASTEPILELTTAQTSGDNTGATDDYHPSCAFSGNTAGDLTYSLNLPTTLSLTILLDPMFSADLVGELLPPSCGSADLACAESDFGSNSITLTNLPAATYFYVVDGWSSGTGPFQITVSGTIAPGQSCEMPLAQSGALQCGLGSICGGPVGSRICQPAQCSDGIDNNADGKIDYPNDPGCSSPADDTETTVCPGIMCPACSNTVDDDADTLTDYPADFGCLAAGDTSELFCGPDPDQGARISAAATNGTNTTTAHNLTFSCQGSTGNDTTYPFQLPVPVTALTIDTEGSATADNVIALRDAHCGAELACNDDTIPGSDLHATIHLANVAAGNYAISVTGFQTTNNGAFVLNVHGTVASGTVCTSPLFAAGVLSCPTGTSCTGGTCH